ncbi:MAG: TlpA disulfide reductase family protein, partial [Acidobacteriota bacterium]
MAEQETNPDFDPSLPVPNSRPRLGLEAKAAFAVVAAFVAFALLGPTGEDNSAPDGILQDAGGGEVDIVNVMAPVTLVHFWSTWCPPCITETPSIQRLAQSYQQHREFALVMVVTLGEALDRRRLGDARRTPRGPEVHQGHGRHHV